MKKSKPSLHYPFIFFSIFIMGIASPTIAINPTTLTKSPEIMGLMLKTYTISSTEPITLYGAMRRHLLDDHWYWGEFGSGAILGKRSGYLEGGIVGGYILPLPNRWLLDTQLMIGAGGGGGAPQGGGLILNPSVALGVHITPTWFLEGSVGYIQFLNGDIESLTVSIGIHTHFLKLSIKDSRED